MRELTGAHSFPLPKRHGELDMTRQWEWVLDADQRKQCPITLIYQPSRARIN